MLCIENQNLRLASDQRSLQLLVGQPLIQRYADSQTTQNRKIAFQPLLLIFAYDGDTLSLHTAQHHGCTEQRDAVIKFRERNMRVADIFPCFLLEDERVILPKAFGAIAQQRAQIFVAYRRKNAFQFSDFHDTYSLLYVLMSFFLSASFGSRFSAKGKQISKRIVLVINYLLHSFDNYINASKGKSQVHTTIYRYENHKIFYDNYIFLL